MTDRSVWAVEPISDAYTFGTEMLPKTNFRPQAVLRQQELEYIFNVPCRVVELVLTLRSYNGWSIPHLQLVTPPL